MALAVVRSRDAPQRLETAQQREDLEQEPVDQYRLAAVGARTANATVGRDRSV
jgi:hypothetical protein